MDTKAMKYVVTPVTIMVDSETVQDGVKVHLSGAVHYLNGGNVDDSISIDLTVDGMIVRATLNEVLCFYAPITVGMRSGNDFFIADFDDDEKMWVVRPVKYSLPEDFEGEAYRVDNIITYLTR